ncbi:hypothetical protein MMAN_04600 [Mycobacterium mantenii]|uniref:DUF2742 domain-containing protein n=1 Tax=Mycobacterium mantenii TaxID=560555 RepID=A0ABM7JLF8_MYCNT|nr:DUF2742 domain-containing protein [Mycobacterium mantenii]BBY36326.1 hypothetical protein MMAN_04600 [Mycobacterium mantenii]
MKDRDGPPTKKVGAPPQGSPNHGYQTHPKGSSPAQPNAIASQQVSWWETHQFVERMLAQANTGQLPWAGSPAWCAMADGDPRKVLALAVDGEHHVLRKEVAQTAQAAAARAIAGAADWPAMGNQMRSRAAFYDARPWLRRAAQ